MKTASGRTVTGHAHKADRLLIRPASGRQAGTGRSSPGHITRKTPAKQGHPLAESQAKSTGTNLTTAPDGTATDSQMLSPGDGRVSAGDPGRSRCVFSIRQTDAVPLQCLNALVPFSRVSSASLETPETWFSKRV